MWDRRISAYCAKHRDSGDEASETTKDEGFEKDTLSSCHD